MGVLNKLLLHSRVRLHFLVHEFLREEKSIDRPILIKKIHSLKPRKVKGNRVIEIDAE